MKTRQLQRATLLGALALAMIFALLFVGATMVKTIADAPPAQRELAGFSTSLRGRDAGQRRNAQLAARSIDGRIIAPGATFSFNQAVRSWSVDRGYVKALVSYDGELVRAYGGGVCQTSTTLYNAVLLAGLPITERHPHVFVPHYITPGRDAAVAFPGIDLRFRNTTGAPLRIRAGVVGERLQVALIGAGRAPRARVQTQLLSVTRPQRLTRTLGGERATRRGYLRSAGTAGYRVVTTRTLDGRRETLSDDTYPAMDRVVMVRR